MLRTGQMRLPVRTIKPVTQQMPVVIQQMPAIPPPLPDFPFIGEYYLYNGKKVQCVESDSCHGCVNINRPCSNSLVKKCRADMRPDGKSVIFIKAD